MEKETIRMALFKTSDCNSIRVTKGKKCTKRISRTLKEIQVIALLTMISFVK